MNDRLAYGREKIYLDKIQPETPNFNRKPEDICAFFQKKPAALCRNTAEISSRVSQKFDRMVFQRMGKQDNAGRFERGCLNVITENLTSWTWSRREKPPKTCFRGALKTDHFKKKLKSAKKQTEND